MTDSSSRPEQDQEPGFFRTFGRDLRRVLADTRRVGLKRSMSRSLTELQEFYFTTERRDRLAGMGKVKRWLFLSFWLFKSLFLRLTPARRILLLLALLLLSVGSTSFTVGDDIQISLRLPSVGVALLLVILMLELKDKLLSHEEMQAGRVVQRALMPERSPEVSGWEVCLYTQSANEVGGALVDYLALDAGLGACAHAERRPHAASHPAQRVGRGDAASVIGAGHVSRCHLRRTAGRLGHRRPAGRILRRPDGSNEQGW